jgi:N-acylneuraminate cytidylyltransferase
MKILALIPARGGSKRLPEKNIRVLGSKPLIVWSIDAARGISEICNILISTDDPAIANVCSEVGVHVPWLRPAELATDIAGSSDVALHALNWYESENGPVDGILLLQPTSPFRTNRTVRKGIELFAKHDRKPVIGVSPADVHPMWALKLDGHHLVPFMSEHGLETRSQDLPPAYVVNGSFYLITPKELRENRTFFGKEAIPLLIESAQEALDIDTEWDWTIAEAALSFDN